MIWLVIGVVVYYLFIRFFVRREIYKVSRQSHWFKIWAYISLWVASTATIIVLPNIFIGRSLPKYWMEYESIPLVGFTENRETPYFLNKVSCIRNKEGKCYSYYKKSGRSYYYYEVSVDKSVLYEEDRKDGLLRIYRHGFNRKLYWLISFFPLGNEKYEFFIPNGSLSRDN